MNVRSRSMLLAAAAAAFGLAITPAEAATVIADFNDMNLGDIDADGQPAGTGAGFSENYWNTSGGTGVIVAINGDLAAPASTNYGIVQGGNARTVTNDNPTAKRRQSRGIDQLSGTVWFSFLAQSKDDQDRVFLDFDPGNSRDEVRRSAVSVFDDRLIVWNDTSGLNQFADEFTLGQTALVLGKLEIGAGTTSGNDKLTVWIDPDVSGGESGLTGAITLSDIDMIGADTSLTRIGVQSYRENNALLTGGLIDAIRLSDEADGFSFVTGYVIPEPASLALLGLGGLLMLPRRRRG